MCVVHGIRRNCTLRYRQKQYRNIVNLSSIKFDKLHRIRHNIIIIIITLQPRKYTQPPPIVIVTVISLSATHKFMKLTHSHIILLLLLFSITHGLILIQA